MWGTRFFDKTYNDFQPTWMCVGNVNLHENHKVHFSPFEISLQWRWLPSFKRKIKTYDLGLFPLSLSITKPIFLVCAFYLPSILSMLIRMNESRFFFLLHLIHSYSHALYLTSKTYKFAITLNLYSRKKQNEGTEEE